MAIICQICVVSHQRRAVYSSPPWMCPTLGLQSKSISGQTCTICYLYGVVETREAGIADILIYCVVLSTQRKPCVRGCVNCLRLMHTLDILRGSRDHIPCVETSVVVALCGRVGTGRTACVVVC
jgi:hypothetical protein